MISCFQMYASCEYSYTNSVLSLNVGLSLNVFTFLQYLQLHRILALVNAET